MAEQRHVLVVDDEPAVCEFLGLTIRAMGFTVDTALHGQAALDMAARRPPCFALVDALLPRMDGFQLVAALKKQCPGLPVVMMSGIYKKRSYESEALDKLGCKAYVQKPLPVLKVWELVETYAGTAPVGGPIPADFPGTSLRDRPLAKVVADLLTARDTGLLFVRGSGGTAVLFVESGKLIFGRSNDPQTRLDRILLAAGKLDPAKLTKARELLTSNRGNERFGELLVRERILGTEDLQAALLEQQRLHVLRPFSWSDGSCHFFRSDAPRDERFKLTFDMVPLLFWACRQIRDEACLEAWLPRPDMRVGLARPLDDLADQVGLSAAEREFVALLDGTRDMAKLRAIGRLAQVDANHVLAGLHCLGLLQAQGSGEGERAPAADTRALAAPTVGDLSRMPPASLLSTLHFARATGVLRVEAAGSDPPAVRSIFFEGGSIACATSNSPQDRLGQVLVRAGIVRPEQVNAALEAARQLRTVGLGRILLDHGALRPDDLHRALVVQVHSVVAGLLAWRTGSFHFQEGPLPTREIVPLYLDTLSTVLCSVRGMSFSDVAPRLPSADVSLHHAWNCSALVAALPLNELETRLIESTAEPAVMRELLARLPAPPEEILRAVHALLAIGVIEGRSVGATQRAPSPARRAEAALVEEFGDTAVDESGATSTGVETFGEESFAERDEPSRAWSAPAGAPPPARDEAEAWDNASMAKGATEPALPDFEIGDADLDSLLTGLATAPGLESQVGVFTCEEPAREVGFLDADEIPAVADFLALLAAQMGHDSQALPEHLRATLPPALRRRFGL